MFHNLIGIIKLKCKLLHSWNVIGLHTLEMYICNECDEIQ